MHSDHTPDWIVELNELFPGPAAPEPTFVQTQRLIELVFGRAGDPRSGLPEGERAAAIDYYLQRARTGGVPDRVG